MLGQAVIRLYHQHYDIHFIGRNQTLGDKIAKQYCAVFHQIDLSHSNSIKSLDLVCSDAYAVVHCAALSSPWGKESDFVSANVKGTNHILAAAEKSNVQRFIHISTPSLYFDFKSQTGIKESSSLPQLFCNEYAATKAQAEQAVLSSPLHTFILRPRGIFGPEDNAIAPRLLGFIKNNQLLLPSSRDPLVDLTYVDNVADAIILSVESNCESGNIFNISNGEPAHIKSLLTELLNALVPNTRIKGLNYNWVKVIVKWNQWVHQYFLNHKEPRLTNYSAALLHYDQTLDISKAQEMLGYQPKVSIREGIKRYANWYKSPTI